MLQKSHSIFNIYHSSIAYTVLITNNGAQKQNSTNVQPHMQRDPGRQSRGKLGG